MAKQTGTARTIGGAVVLISMVLKYFKVELEVSEADVLVISNAVGAVVLAYGVVVNILKRIKSMIGKK